MSSLRIDCPHCGSSFEVQIDGEPSNMMVFCCARCKTPLMYFHGEISEMDREEFSNLRKRLARALDAVVSRDNSMSEVAETIKKMVEESEERAAENEANQAAKIAITDDFLQSLQQDLDSLDADSFLDKL